MKGRMARRRSAVSAAPMTVRSRVPIGVKLVVALAVCFALLAAGVGGVLVSRNGREHAAAIDRGAEIARLGDEVKALRAERDRAVETAAPADSRSLIERSTIEALGQQVARLEADNTRLKEDVAFFEAATADRSPSKAGDGGIAIRRFQVVQDAAGRLVRYRLLLTQDSRASRDFVGDLQLVATIEQGGGTTTITLPEAPPASAATRPAGRPASRVAAADPASPFAVAFRSYKRIDGTFDLPPDATLRSVQARILERGAVRAQQTASPDG